MVPKGSLIMIQKSFLSMAPKNSLIMVKKKSLIMAPNSSLIVVPKGSLMKDPKSTKSSSIVKPLHTYKPFLIIFTSKSILKIRTLRKIKCKFAIDQLKSAKSPVQLSK